MGTALASFVAGALIVFTMFDQTQVTRVDALEGSIRELRVEIQTRMEEEPFTGTQEQRINRIDNVAAESLREARDYLVYLEREADRRPERRQVAENREQFFSSMIDDTRNIISAKEDLLDEVRDDQVLNTDYLQTEAQALSLKLKQIRTRVNAFLLQVHLNNRARESDKSEDHYRGLLETIDRINTNISEFDAYSSREKLRHEVKQLEEYIVPLKRQSPYTLLMMRVVEIGLPVLLSLFSFFFISRYSLTEERLQEIKQLLKARNAKRDA